MGSSSSISFGSWAMARASITFCCSPLEQLRKEQISRWEEMEIQEHMSYYTDQGMDRKEAMKAVEKDRGITTRDVYQQLL